MCDIRQTKHERIPLRELVFSQAAERTDEDFIHEIGGGGDTRAPRASEQALEPFALQREEEGSVSVLRWAGAPAGAGQPATLTQPSGFLSIFHSCRPPL